MSIKRKYCGTFCVLLRSLSIAIFISILCSSVCYADTNAQTAEKNTLGADDPAKSAGEVSEDLGEAVDTDTISPLGVTNGGAATFAFITGGNLQGYSGKPAGQ